MRGAIRGAPGFIGDMPHTWVGAEYVRSVRTLFAYEREGDGALVLGAGCCRSGSCAMPGVSVRRMPTYYGTLNYSVRPGSGAELVATIRGDLLCR